MSQVHGVHFLVVLVHGVDYTVSLPPVFVSDGRAFSGEVLAASISSILRIYNMKPYALHMDLCRVNIAAMGRVQQFARQVDAEDIIANLDHVDEDAGAEASEPVSGAIPAEER